VQPEFVDSQDFLQALYIYIYYTILVLYTHPFLFSHLE
jgi:hypothetical protein